MQGPAVREAAGLQDKKAGLGGPRAPAPLRPSCWGFLLRAPAARSSLPAGRPWAHVLSLEPVSSALLGQVGASGSAPVKAGCPPPASPCPRPAACGALPGPPSPLQSLPDGCSCCWTEVWPHGSPGSPVVEYVGPLEVSFLWEEQEPQEASVGSRAPLVQRPPLCPVPVAAASRGWAAGDPPPCLQGKQVRSDAGGLAAAFP